MTHVKFKISRHSWNSMPLAVLRILIMPKNSTVQKNWKPLKTFLIASNALAVLWITLMCHEPLCSKCLNIMMLMKFHDVDVIQWCWWNSMIFIKFLWNSMMKFHDIYEILWWKFTIYMKFYDEDSWYLWNSMMKCHVIFEIPNSNSLTIMLTKLSTLLKTNHKLL